MSKIQPVSSINAGFSLIELLLALTITLGIGWIGFQLFIQNERVFRDQAEVLESSQSTRAVAFQIADEIRRAGQGVPIWAASFDTVATEATAAILPGSDSTHFRVREGSSNVETTVTTTPADYLIDSSRSVTVTDTSIFSAALGTSAPHGRFVYISGSGSLSCWGWVRAEITAINASGKSLTLIPRQAGEGCQDTPASVRFTSTQTLTLEECVSIFFNAGSIWKATATDSTNPGAPVWGPASELGREMQELVLTYYDRKDHLVVPTALAERNTIARVDVRVRGRSGNAVNIRSVPRNLLTARR